jgi:hypothetical protein
MTWRLSIIAKSGSNGVTSYRTLADARREFKEAVFGAMMNPRIATVILRDSEGKPLHQWPAEGGQQCKRKM